MFKLKFDSYWIKAIACKIKLQYIWNISFTQTVLACCRHVHMIHYANYFFQEHKVKRLQMSRAEEVQFIFHV